MAVKHQQGDERRRQQPECGRAEPQAVAARGREDQHQQRRYRKPLPERSRETGRQRRIGGMGSGEDLGSQHGELS